MGGVSCSGFFSLRCCELEDLMLKDRNRFDRRELLRRIMVGRDGSKLCILELEVDGRGTSARGFSKIEFHVRLTRLSDLVKPERIDVVSEGGGPSPQAAIYRGAKLWLREWPGRESLSALSGRVPRFP